MSFSRALVSFEFYSSHPYKCRIVSEVANDPEVAVHIKLILFLDEDISGVLIIVAVGLVSWVMTSELYISDNFDYVLSIYLCD